MSDFTVKLGDLSTREICCSFVVKDKFFEAFPFSDIKHADIAVVAQLNKNGDNILLKLSLGGCINKLACDICTEELSIKISVATNIIIKRTDKNIFSTDEIIYVKPNENKLDLKQLVFELIVLNTPKKRKHDLDKKGNSKCNEEMIKLVKKYTTVRKKASDPRWDVLKNLNIK